MTAREVHAKMAAIGVRIFKITLRYESKTEEQFWIHPNKTTEEWRKDLNGFFNDVYYDDIPLEKNPKEEIDEGYASDQVFNNLNYYMTGLGYHELNDVISDVFEGRITNEKAQLVKRPAHEEQETGFGHYGWESKLLSDK